MSIDNVTAKRWIKLFFSMSLILWSISIALSDLEIGSYGLISSVNPLFFVALFLLTISFLLILNFDAESKMLPVEIITFYCMLYFLPLLLEKTAGFTYSYLTYGYTEYIIRNGFINAEYLPYQNWPGLMFFGCIMTFITQLAGTQILYLYPIIIKPITLVAIYWIFSALTKDRVIRGLATLIFLIGDWTSYGYYTPPSLGVFFSTFIISLLLLSIYQRRENITQWTITIIILLFSIVVSHLLSSIVAFVSLFIIFIILKIYKRPSNIGIVLFPVVLVSWLIFCTSEFVSRNASRAIAQMFDASAIVTSTAQSSVGLGMEHTTVMYIKIAFIILFSAIAALGILYTLTIKEQRTSLSTIIPLVLIISSAIIMPLITGAYSGEIISRAFGYTAPFLAFFIAKNWNNKAFKIIIVVFLFIAPLLFVISAFGNAKLDYVSPSEISGVDFYYETSNHKDPIYSLSQRIWSYEYIEDHSWQELNISSKIVLSSQVNKGYVAVYKRDFESYQFLNSKIDVVEIKDSIDSNYANHVYTSSDFDIYYRG